MKTRQKRPFHSISCLLLLFLIGCAGTLPDLIVELNDIPYGNLKGFNPSPPLTDRAAIATVYIQNVGKKDIEKGFSTALYVDDKLAKTWTFPSENEKKDLGPKTKILLKSGGTRLYDYGTTISSPGKHKFRWVVDSDSEIGESDEKNNILDTTMVWQAPPDLVVNDMWSTVKATGGQKLVWKIEIKNEGKGDAQNPFLTVFWPAIAGGAQENFVTDYLAAGEKDTLTSTQWFNTWGTAELTATVDANYRVAEVLPNGEKNNELVKEIDLAYVDLTVKNVSISPSFITAYSAVTFTYTIANAGTGDANQAFKVRIYPGQITGSGQAEEAIVTVSGLKAGQSTILKNSVKLPPGSYQACIEADAFEPDAVYFEPNRTNNTWCKNIDCEGMRKGLVYSTDNDITPTEMEAYLKNDPLLETYRQKVALTALAELKLGTDSTNPYKGLCGDDARDRYDASGYWCSEFAAWVLLQAGMKNLCYCDLQVIGCWDTDCLDDVTLTADLVKVFDRNGNRFKWASKGQVSPQTAGVGDFMSQASDDGKKKNHSAIVVAVSYDYKVIWTVEGNAGDCVYFGYKDYFPDGKTLNPVIDGFGHLDANIFP
jgi:hypothetical protein